MGSRIDCLARVPLWNAGLDYNHGTGHGVGAYLNVHEGPHGIGFRKRENEMVWHIDTYIYVDFCMNVDIYEYQYVDVYKNRFIWICIYINIDVHK